jgi:hypothetical protein
MDAGSKKADNKTFLGLVKKWRAFTALWHNRVYSQAL